MTSRYDEIRNAALARSSDERLEDLRMKWLAVFAVLAVFSGLVGCKADGVADAERAAERAAVALERAERAEWLALARYGYKAAETREANAEWWEWEARQEAAERVGKVRAALDIAKEAEEATRAAANVARQMGDAAAARRRAQAAEARADVAERAAELAEQLAAGEERGARELVKLASELSAARRL